MTADSSIQDHIKDFHVENIRLKEIIRAAHQGIAHGESLDTVLDILEGGMSIDQINSNYGRNEI